MEKKLITQAERTKLFNEWLEQQEIPKFDTVVERKKWWCQKVVEYDKMFSAEFDIIPDFDNKD